MAKKVRLVELAPRGRKEKRSLEKSEVLTNESCEKNETSWKSGLSLMSSGREGLTWVLCRGRHGEGKEGDGVGGRLEFESSSHGLNGFHRNEVCCLSEGKSLVVLFLQVTEGLRSHLTKVSVRCKGVVGCLDDENGGRVE